MPMRSAIVGETANLMSLRKYHERTTIKHMQKRSKQRKQPLTLHGLLAALSFWGTATRTLLFGVLWLAVVVVALSEATTAARFDMEIMTAIYVLGSYMLLDFGYVSIARAYPLVKQLDVAALVIAEVLLAALYIVPKVVVSQSVVLRVDPLVFAFFVPLVVLSLRMLVGILTSPAKR